MTSRLGFLIADGAWRLAKAERIGGRDVHLEQADGTQEQAAAWAQV
jgi:hypothetical protein